MTVQSDPFAAVRIKSKSPAIAQKVTDTSIDNRIENDPFSSVRIKKAEGFPEVYETGRHAARIGSRIAETIGGLPGDIGKLIQSGVFSGLEKLTGHKASPEVYEEAKKFRSPSSTELQELSESLTGGLTSPKTPTEKTIDEYVQTASSLFGPIKFRRALGIALGAQSAKEGIKILGAGETPQEAAKLGSLFLLSTINPGGAMKYASSQYEIANKLAKGASISAHNFEKNLHSMVKDLQKGIPTPSKNAVLKPTQDLLNKIRNGKISIEDLTASKRDLNSLMKDPALLKREKKLLKVLGKEVDDAIKPYEKINPAFKKAYRPANEIYGAVMQGTKASDFIRKNLGAKSVLGAISGEILLGHPEFIVPTAGAAAGAIGTAKTLDFFTRVSKSKELQKFYSKAIQAALAEDAGALRLYSDKIEENLNKD
jgi:hypothetical protein